MSLYKIKVKVNNDLTMLFIVTYHEPNITYIYIVTNFLNLVTSNFVGPYLAYLDM